MRSQNLPPPQLPQDRRLEVGCGLVVTDMRFNPSSKLTQESNLLDRVLFIAPGGDLTPPRFVILGEKDLSVPPGQIQFCCVVPVLHTAKPVGEQQCLGSAHAEQDHLSTRLIMGCVVHPARFSRNHDRCQLCSEASLQVVDDRAEDNPWVARRGNA